MTSEITAAANTTPGQVKGALKRASQSTGAGFDFLMKMAARESNFDPSAKAKTSSAAGLFQFIDQTWLSTVKTYGAEHGLGDAAAKISRNSEGKYVVADKAARDEILNLRFNAEASSAMAGELANENKSMLENRLGRAASSADLYTAHFLGPSGAVKLLSAASNVKAADLLPQAASANRNVFYDGARAKSVGEVVASIARSMGGAPAKGGETVGGDSGAPFAMAAASDAGEWRFAPVRNYKHAIIDRGGAPQANKSLPAGTGMSAVALAVLEALDPMMMRSDRDDRDKNSLASDLA